MAIEHNLMIAIRNRIADPKDRIDLRTAGVPPLFETATREALDAAEAELGFALPALLRRVYTEVGNGGFGPGAGLLGVDGGHTDPGGRHLSHSYQALRALGWPQGVLPLCDLGCGAYSAVDLRVLGTHVLTVDATGLTRTQRDLFSWLQAWTTGVDMNADTWEMQSGAIINPFTQRQLAIQQRRRAKGAWLESLAS